MKKVICSEKAPGAIEMVTLDAKNKVLFSGDAFGCFGAL